jgi:hypothetical protein
MGPRPSFFINRFFGRRAGGMRPVMATTPAQFRAAVPENLVDVSLGQSAM